MSSIFKWFNLKFEGNLAIFPNISFELEKMIRQNRSLAELFSSRPSISFQVAWKPSSQEQTLTYSIFSHLVEPSGKRPIPSGFPCCAWVLHIDVSWVVDFKTYLGNSSWVFQPHQSNSISKLWFSLEVKATQTGTYLLTKRNIGSK